MVLAWFLLLFTCCNLGAWAAFLPRSGSGACTFNTFLGTTASLNLGVTSTSNTDCPGDSGGSVWSTGFTSTGNTFPAIHNLAAIPVASSRYVLSTILSPTYGSTNNMYFGFYFRVKGPFTGACSKIPASVLTGNNPFGFSVGVVPDVVSTLTHRTSPSSSCPPDNTASDGLVNGPGLPFTAGIAAGFAWGFDWTRSCANTSAGAFQKSMEAISNSGTSVAGTEGPTVPDHFDVGDPTLNAAGVEVVIKVKLDKSSGALDEATVYWDGILVKTYSVDFSSDFSSTAQVKMFLAGTGNLNPSTQGVTLSDISVFQNCLACMEDPCLIRAGQTNFNNGVTCKDGTDATSAQCHCPDGYATSTTANTASPALFDSVTVPLVWGGSCAPINWCLSVTDNPHTCVGTYNSGTYPYLNSRDVTCAPGYGIVDNSYAQTPQRLSKSTANGCLRVLMCSAIGSTAFATCAEGAVNERIITCNSGYSTNGTREGMSITYTGNTPAAPCNPIQMCTLFPAPVNGVCTFTEPNKRTITCNSGYSTTTLASGDTVTLQGDVPNVDCTSEVQNMCEYHPNPVLGYCSPNGFNSSNITCWEGAGHVNNTNPQITITVNGKGPLPSDCKVLDMCLVYSATVFNGTCIWTANNTRQIQCHSGSSSTNSISGMTATYVGSGSVVPCNVQLNMCLYTDPPSDNPNAPVANGMCVWNPGDFNFRTIICNDGYAADNSTNGGGITKTYGGPIPGSSTSPCIVLDTCQAYHIGPLTQNGATCAFVWTVPNFRTITCPNGWGVNSTSLTDWAIGNAATKTCTALYDMCRYQTTLIRGTCDSLTVRNQRVITCNEGYSANGTTAGTVTVIDGPGTPSITCNQLDMCQYQTVQNADCTSPLNARNYTCHIGYSYDSNPASLVQIINGTSATALPCSNEVDMCVTYSTPLIDAICNQTNPGDRLIECTSGWSTTSAIAGTFQTLNATYAYHQLCDKQLDMCLYSPTHTALNLHGTCTSNGFNSRLITCDNGYTFQNSTTPVLSQNITGKADFFPKCELLDMCGAYSPDTTGQNVTCAWDPSLVYKRHMTCTPGYSTDGTITPSSIDWIITGTALHAPCDVLDMCLYDQTPQNADCFSVAPNVRRITCRDGYSSNNTVQGIIQYVIGPSYGGTYSPCVRMDMCPSYSQNLRNATCSEAGIDIRHIVCTPGNSLNGSIAGTEITVKGNAFCCHCDTRVDMCDYTPSYQLKPDGQYINQTCEWIDTNIRRITCDAGYSSNNTVAGIVQIIQGPTPPRNCTVLDMCSAYSPVLNTTSTASCEFNPSIPDFRIIHCKPGYSWDGTPSGVNQPISGSAPHVDCRQMDMCQYQVPDTYTLNCAETGVNIRTVTCVPGYSSNGTFAGAIQVIAGTAANLPCLQINACALLGCGAHNVSNTSCINGINQRTCTCDLGWSYNGTQEGITMTFIGSDNPFPSGCVDINECTQYPCAGDNVDCTQPAPNLRNCTCQVGWSRNGVPSGRYETLVGNATSTIPCSFALDMCTYYGGCGPNSVCSFVSTSPVSRLCTCNPGYARFDNYTGPDQDSFVIDGAPSHWANCSYQVSECSLYGCGIPLTPSANASCEEDNLPANTRVCRCAVGWSPVNPAQLPSSPLVGNTVFEGCTNVSVCERFGCASSLTADVSSWSGTTECLDAGTLPNGTVTRTCKCKAGYENPNSGFQILGPLPFGTCNNIDECALYGCGAATACEDLVNSRRCYCPPGTTNLTTNSSEVVPGNGVTSIRCLDDDECIMFGCWDNRTKENRTCINEVGGRVCQCPTTLLGTASFMYADHNEKGVFAGCFPKLTVGEVHPLGYTLSAGSYTAWNIATPFDVNGDSVDDIFVVRDGSTVVGWIEGNASATPYPVVNYLDAALVLDSTSPCISPSIHRIGTITRAICSNNGDIYALDFNPTTKQFESISVGPLPTGTSNYGGPSKTCANSNTVLFGKGTQMYNVNTNALTTVTYAANAFPIRKDSTDTVSACAIGDFTSDPGLEIVLGVTSEDPARQGFFWYRQSGGSYVLVGFNLTSSPPAFVSVGNYMGSSAPAMIALTTNCYSMYQANNFYASPGSMEFVPGQDGSCSTCGCGSASGLIPYDFNSDGFMDFISIVSGGAQLFLNENGVLYFQELLGGCDIGVLFNMGPASVGYDLLCSSSGVSVWYELGVPNSCEVTAHNCEQICNNYDWDGFKCSCWSETNRNFQIDEERLALEDRVYCIDVDECAMLNPLTNESYCNVTCNNTWGSFECLCPNSYGYSMSSEGGFCNDLDECTNTSFTPFCDANSACVNVLGGYKCECAKGYEPNPNVFNRNPGYNNTVACKDIDECAINEQERALNSSVPRLCDQLCINNPGSYKCSCNSGWVGSKTCTPVICRWEAWTMWSPNCACGTVQERSQTMTFVRDACNTTNLEQRPCDLISSCKPGDGPPTSLGQADSIMNDFFNSKLVKLVFSPWRRMDVVPSKRQFVETKHDSGVYIFSSPNCTQVELEEESARMLNYTAEILSLPLSKLLLQTVPVLALDPRDNTNDTVANCEIEIDFSGAYPFDYLPMLISLAVGIPLLLAICAYLYWWYKRRELRQKLEVLMNLPPAITKHYRDCIMNPETWERLDNDPVLYRKLLTERKDIKHVEDIFNLLDGSSIKLNQIYAVFNPSLVNQMGLTWEKFENRVATNPQLFYAEKWQHDEKASRSLLKQRQWVKSVFVNRVASFTWNQELSVPIIPTIHGTSASVAWKVCQSGFATLSALDIGFFGAGIYFTTSAKYAVPYFATKPNPAIIISYLVPGNPYPVTEDPNGGDSLAGQPVKPGYQCNYVLTTNRGMPFTQIERRHIFDEIVIRQETQVAPAYVLMLDPKCFPALIRQFERMTSEDDPANNQTDQD